MSWIKNRLNRFFSRRTEAASEGRSSDAMRLSMEAASAEAQMLRQRLELALSSIGIGVWDWDIVHNRLIWDESMFRIFGVDPKTFTGTFFDWYRTLHPEDAVRAAEHVEAARVGKSGFDTRFRIIRKDGIRHIRAVGQVQRDAGGEALRMVGLNWDVTREAELAVELEAQRHFMENILNAVADPIFVKDEQHRWVYGNHAFSVLLDRIPDEYVGKSDHDLYPKEIADKFWESDRDTFTRMTEIEREERILSPDGTERTILTKKTPFSTPDGRKTLVGIIRDITERKAMEKQIQEERARQVGASRLASLGEMAGGVAHEINNPLAIIAGFSSRLLEMLTHGPFDQARAIDIVHRMESTTMRIATIVKGLRAIARDGSLDKKERIELKTVVEETLDLCAERFRDKGIRLDVRLEDGLWVECRPVQISQILLNLLTNAYYAVAVASNANVALEAKRRPDRFVEITVTDSGPGVDPSIRDRIFEPFFTTKPVGAGTGLGLSIASSMVKEHGGELYLDPNSKATRFVLTLPVVSAPTVLSES